MTTTDTQGGTQGLEPRRLSEACADEVGSRLLVSCAPDTPLDEVARRMVTFHVHAVVVFREPATHGAAVPWSVITDLDVARAAASGEHPTADVVATEPIVAVSATASLIEAAQAMARASVSHAIVTDPDSGRPTGIISALDVVRAYAVESFR